MMQSRKNYWLVVLMLFAFASESVGALLLPCNHDAKIAQVAETVMAVAAQKSADMSDCHHAEIKKAAPQKSASLWKDCCKLSNQCAFGNAVTVFSDAPHVIPALEIFFNPFDYLSSPLRGFTSSLFKPPILA